MNRRFLGAMILAAAVTAILNSQWTFSDHRYQRDDTGSLMEAAQEVYLVAKTHGAVTGARFAYFHRHWRPVAAPLLAVPFLFAADGDTRAAFRLYSVTCAALLAAVIFLGLHAWIGHAGAALMGTFALMWTPWILDDQFRLWTELPWLICAAGFFLGLARSRMGLCVFFLTGAMLCRPLESAIGLFLPFAYLLVTGAPSWKKKHAGLMLAESAVLLAIAIKPSGGEYAFETQARLSAFALAYAFVKLFLLFRFKRGALRVQFFWTLSWLIPFIWYLPGFATLWDWIAMSTWGPGTKRLNLAHHAGAPVVPKFFANAGWLLWLPAAFLVLKFREVIAYRRAHRPGAVVLRWAAFAMVTIGMFTVSRDFRYYQASWLALFFMMAAALGAVLPARKVALIFFGVAAAQAAIVWPHYFPHRRIGFLKPLGGDLSGSRAPESDLGFEAFNDFLRGLPLKPHAALIFSDERDDGSVRLLMNPWKHVLRARENGLFWRGNIFDNDWDGGDTPAELISLAGRSGDVLVVGGPYPDSKSRPAILSRAVFECFEKGCAEYGLKSIGRYRDPGGHEFRVLEFAKPHYVPEAGKENLLRCFVEFQEFLGQH